MNTYTFDRVFRLFLTSLLAIGSFFLLKHLSDVLLPFFIALLLAYLLNPLVNKIQSKVKHRTLSVLLSLFSVFATASLLLGLLLPYLYQEFQAMSALIMKFAHNKEMAKQLNSVIESDLWFQLQHQIQDFLGGQWKQWIQDKDHWALIQNTLNKLLPGALGILSGAGTILGVLLGGVVILLYLIFMLTDFERFKKEGVGFLPDHWREPLFDFIGDFNQAMHQYFRAQAILALIVGVLFAFGFSLIGLPMAILLGLGIGALNMVPYLQIVGIIPAAFLAIIHALEVDASPWGVLFWVALVFIVVQAIQEAILTPKLMGDVTGLSPALILLSISIWGKLLGFLGLLLAIPITCICVAYWARYQKMILNAIDTSNSP